MKTRILLIEDDKRLADLTAEYLRKNEFEVHIESRGDTAEARILKDNPDLVILDVMLPGKDGFEVCRSVRAQYTGVILMLTARDEDLDQILGLELGADDYIAKPVQPRLLLARIKALLRRAPLVANEQGAASETEELAFGNFGISQATRSAHLGDEPIDLTTAEVDLLWLLASHPLARRSASGVARHWLRRTRPFDRRPHFAPAPQTGRRSRQSYPYQDGPWQRLPLQQTRLAIARPAANTACLTFSCATSHRPGAAAIVCHACS